MNVFVDTNVLVYARDDSEPEKQRQAEAWMSTLWTSLAGRTSVQVLNEFYVTVTRKLSPSMSISDARSDVRDLSTWAPVPISASLVSTAWAIADRYGLSHWDSLVVAAAQSASCDYLLTEDLQDELKLGNVTVVNPFAHHPEGLL